MNRAITFCAIALGIPVATYLIANGYMSTLSDVSDIHANNGLECTLKTGGKGDLISGYVLHIEFLRNNTFRVVDENSANDILANDYIGTMTTTDTTYTFDDDPEPNGVVPPKGSDKLLNDLNDIIANNSKFYGFVVDRITTKLYGHHTFPGEDRETTTTGWCAPAYVPPRPVPKKL